MAIHSLRITDEQWQKAEEIAKEIKANVGFQLTPTTVLLQLLNDALETTLKGMRIPSQDNSSS